MATPGPWTASEEDDAGSQSSAGVRSNLSREDVAKDEAALELHRVVFHGDPVGTEEALEKGASVSTQDRFGVCLAEIITTGEVYYSPAVKPIYHKNLNLNVV